MPTSSLLRSGAIAGVLSSTIFMAFHQLIISNIWGTWPIMIGAGALCGLCIAWSYGTLCKQPGVRSWWGYNLAFITMFFVLGVVSELMYSPITTMAAVIDANESPDELFGDAMPLIIAFTVGSPAVVVALFGRQWGRYWPVLVTSVVLMLTLGMNVSIIGLVEIPMAGYLLVAGLLVLTAALGALYAAGFWALERRALSHRALA